jgi:hypothetical protein
MDPLGPKGIVVVGGVMLGDRIARFSFSYKCCHRRSKLHIKVTDYTIDQGARKHNLNNHLLALYRRCQSKTKDADSSACNVTVRFLVNLHRANNHLVDI